MYEKNEPGLKDCWVKFALLILALFLGSYLATYFIIDQTRHSYYINPMRENGYMNKYYDEALWDKDFKRDFDEMDAKMNSKDIFSNTIKLLKLLKLMRLLNLL
ncbi:MAG: hypothetical protein L6V95_00805 [Candidatus Melainabacteria bacterium]|nr:MAG: hypothetical protein L6V95_00805 [Candidatus Melainabacteria bacterium]